MLEELIDGLQIIQKRQPNAKWKNHACGIMVEFEDFLWTDEEVSSLESMGWYEHEGAGFYLKSSNLNTKALEQNLMTIEELEDLRRLIYRWRNYRNLVQRNSNSSELVSFDAKKELTYKHCADDLEEVLQSFSKDEEIE